MNTKSVEFFKKNEPAIWHYWSKLSLIEQKQLLDQLQSFDQTRLEQQKSLLHSPPIKNQVFESFNDFAKAGSVVDKEVGKQFIQKGRLGCLVLAGGQGTRLRFNQPKGCYPISVIKHKSLFQLLAEKVKAASQQANHPLFLAIMTSPENDLEIREFFKKHTFFGLMPSQLFFFSQSTLPLLDVQGHLFLDTPSHIAEGSDGNGNALHHFVHSGIASQWKDQGITHLHVILIDNPLADPFDAELLGFHTRQQVDVTLKCTEKKDPEEKVGVLVKEENRCRIVEYSELPESERQAKTSDGQLKHCCANLSLFCFSLPFITEQVKKNQQLPLHAAWKNALFLDPSQNTILSTYPIAWKFETFIFDWLTWTSKVAVLLYPREECFAPLKNFSGADSSETVRQALLKKDQHILQKLTGLTPPNFPIELAAAFHYPSSQLIQEWWHKQPQHSYLDF
jgi:UDP-N-acetylglucosamine/UDP-N-acetylgalactosamine diphosphorylase